MSHITELTLDEAKWVLKLGVDKKHFRYSKVTEVFEFNPPFAHMFIEKAQYILKEMEWASMLEPEHPIVNIWKKIQVATSKPWKASFPLHYYDNHLHYDGEVVKYKPVKTHFLGVVE